MSTNFLQYQVNALQKELTELIDLSSHSNEILFTFLEKSSELESEDRKYVQIVNKELTEKLNKLKFLNEHGK